jgi:glycerophosphoryl diester phosphodiesterase
VKAPQVIAHRGSSARHADNSWAAYEAAIADGADAIECDVQRSRDAVLVIRHDLAIDGQRVVDLSAAELGARTGELVTLQELLEWAAPTRIGLLVEIKDPDTAVAVAAMIAASPMRERSVIGSFSAPALAKVNAARSGVRTSFMMGSVVGADNLIHLAAACRADGVHLCWESRAPRPHRLLDADAIKRLRDGGLAITLWHEERDDELRALVALGPDAICTNTPAELRRIVDAYPAITDTGRGDALAAAAPTNRTGHPAARTKD